MKEGDRVRVARIILELAEGEDQDDALEVAEELVPFLGLEGEVTQVLSSKWYRVVFAHPEQLQEFTAEELEVL